MYPVPSVYIPANFFVNPTVNVQFCIFIVYNWRVGLLLFYFILLLSSQGRPDLAGV